MHNLMSLRAVLWDFDGTLANTEPAWIQSQIEVMASYGLTYTVEQGRAKCGISADAAVQKLLEVFEAQTGSRPDISPTELWKQVENKMLHYLQSNPLPWRPGAEELLDEINQAGIPMALVSASSRPLIDAALAHLEPGIFSAVAAGDELPQPKPAPDGYLLAAGLLGVDAEECLVIEDSVSGTQAGRSSGAVVLAVPCMKPLDEHPGQVIRSSLAGIDVSELSRIWHKTKELSHE